MNTVNLNNATFVNGQFLNSNSWGDLAFDNDGSFSVNEQSMTFASGENEIVVEFSYDVEASIEEDNGNYDSPSCGEAIIGDVSVSVEKVYINDVEVNVSDEMFSLLTEKVEKELN